MTVQSVTVELPVNLYNRLKRRAEQTHRSIEAEVVEAVADALPADDDLPAELQQAMVRLAALNDAALVRAATGQFPVEKSARLESLHLRRQTGEWNEAHAEEAASLSSEVEEFVFLRAYAMSLLMQRGHSPADILQE